MREGGTFTPNDKSAQGISILAYILRLVNDRALMIKSCTLSESQAFRCKLTLSCSHKYFSCISTLLDSNSTVLAIRSAYNHKITSFTGFGDSRSAKIENFPGEHALDPL